MCLFSCYLDECFIPLSKHVDARQRTLRGYPLESRAITATTTSNYNNGNRQLIFKLMVENAWAQTKSIKETRNDKGKQDVGHTNSSLPIFGDTYSTKYQSHAFVPVAPHPGMVHFNIK